MVDLSAGQTCGEYLAKFVELSGGTLYNKGANSACEYCAMSTADQYLAGRRIHWSDRWRNCGISSSTEKTERSYLPMYSVHEKQLTERKQNRPVLKGWGTSATAK